MGALRNHRGRGTNNSRFDRASSLLIGGKWTAVASAADQGDGWVTVQLGGHLRINVRSSSIEAVKFTDVQPGRKQLDFAFDLGAN